MLQRWAVGIADVMMKAAGDAGRVYQHFAGKADLAAEACAIAFERSVDSWRRVAQEAARTDATSSMR